MIREYIDEALAEAKYEIIKDETPFYGEVPGLDGVYATGYTLEECRQNLSEVIDDWLIVRLKKGLYIPSLGSRKIEELRDISVNA